MSQTANFYPWKKGEYLGHKVNSGTKKRVRGKPGKLRSNEKKNTNECNEEKVIREGKGRRDRKSNRKKGWILGLERSIKCKYSKKESNKRKIRRKEGQEGSIRDKKGRRGGRNGKGLIRGMEGSKGKKRKKGQEGGIIARRIRNRKKVRNETFAHFTAGSQSSISSILQWSAEDLVRHKKCSGNSVYD